MNVVVLVGRLTRDPELAYTANGKPKTAFNLAVDRKFKNANGEKEADFIRCVAWGKLAETIANNLSKGRRIGVEGRLNTYSYEKDGRTVYVTEVVLSGMEFLDKKQESNDRSSQEEDPSYFPEDDGLEEVPF